jgi:formylmethanofuran dehydrogenase subunit E
VTLEEVTIKIPENDLPGPPREKAVCSACGEEVMDGRQIKKGGQALCRACANGAYYRKK